MTAPAKRKAKKRSVSALNEWPTADERGHIRGEGGSKETVFGPNARRFYKRTATKKRRRLSEVPR